MFTKLHVLICKINAIFTYPRASVFSCKEPKKWEFPQLLSKYKNQYHKDLWYMTEQWPRDKLNLLYMTSWRNGSASDSRSEGCVFESRRGQLEILFYFIHKTILIHWLFWVSCRIRIISARSRQLYNFEHKLYNDHHDTHCIMEGA